METIKQDGFTLSIRQDEDAQSPAQSEGNDLFLVAGHRDFYVPENGQKRVDMEESFARYKKTHWAFPLEAYIHSGVRLAFGGQGNFPDRQWDVSSVGYVFVSKADWKTKAKAIEAAKSLIGEWNQYLAGDVWGYVIEDENGKHLDSCWGFYGLEYAKKEAMEALKAATKNHFDPKI